MTSAVKAKHSHYYKDVTCLESVDIYRVLTLFNVTDPCIQHAVKKLLVAGGRGAGKDIRVDIQESIDSLKRWQEMREEEERIIPNSNVALNTFWHCPGDPDPFTPPQQVDHEYLVKYTHHRSTMLDGRIPVRARTCEEAIDAAQEQFTQGGGRNMELYAWDAVVLDVPEPLARV